LVVPAQAKIRTQLGGSREQVENKSRTGLHDCDATVLTN
jgi:hypothetical protein